MKTFKNLFLILFVLISQISYSQGPSNNIQYKYNNIEFLGFWDTLLVDAGGALGGAGSVASLIGPASATPLGAGAVVAGAVLGGASASVAYNKSSGINIVPTKTKGNNDNLIKNNLNKEDYVGNEHNNIIIDFFQSNSTWESSNFYNFTINRKSNNINYLYEGKPIISLEEYHYIITDINQLTDYDSILSYILSQLPKSVNKKFMTENINNLRKSNDLKTMVSNIKAFESAFFKKHNKLSSVDTLIMNSFFSTMRYSSSLWN